MVSTNRPCTSRLLMAHKICCPRLPGRRGRRCGSPDMQSMGKRALMPQPTSQNAPNGFDMGHGARQDIAGRRVSRYSALHICWASAAGEPVEGLTALIGIQRFNDKKQVGRPTRVSTAISRTEPFSAPRRHTGQRASPLSPRRSRSGAAAGYQRRGQCSAGSRGLPWRRAVPWGRGGSALR